MSCFFFPIRTIFWEGFPTKHALCISKLCDVVILTSYSLIRQGQNWHGTAVVAHGFRGRKTPNTNNMSAVNGR